MPSKKEIEAHYLGRFKSLLEHFPEGEIQPSEEPDFLIRGDNHTIGIELTELHREAPEGTIPLQATEAMRQRVITRAQQLYTATNLPPVTCAVFMNAQHIQKGEVESLAMAIVDIAVRNLPLPNSSKSEEFDWENREYFPEAINSISVHRLAVLTETHFHCPGATWVGQLSDSDIERALEAKETKYLKYRLQCDEAWLLVIIDTGAMATWFQLSELSMSKEVYTSFDKVFLISNFGSKLHLLPTCNLKSIEEN